MEFIVITDKSLKTPEGYFLKRLIMEIQKTFKITFTNKTFINGKILYLEDQLLLK